MAEADALNASLPNPHEPVPGRAPVWLAILDAVLLGAALLFWTYAVLTVRP